MSNDAQDRTFGEFEFDPDAGGERRPMPRLVLALERESPAAPRWSASLAGCEAVSIVRGERTECAHTDGGRHLLVTIADGWMSKQHARLVPDAGRWLLLDEGSRNGTFVNGRRAERALLSHGDLVEVGRTHLCFSSAANDGPLAAEAIRSIDPARLGPAAARSTLCPAFDALLREIERVARLPAAVLLTGETGTGKERIARAVHELSGRRGEFVAVNCGGIRAELVESELFGSRRGAFTGAVERAGLIRAAHGGTLLLDEIGDLPLAAQAALLRVLEEREVMAVGASRAEKVDFRLVSATHWDLPALIAAGRFRADLFGRIRGYEATLPPLRARREDIGWLIGVLLVEVCGATPPRLSREAARALLGWRWPRNVRELKQCLAAAVGLVGGGDVIELGHLPAELRAGEPEPSGASAAPASVSGEHRGDDSAGWARRRERLTAALAAEGGNISRAARALNTTRVQVHRWMKRLGIDPKQYRD